MLVTTLTKKMAEDLTDYLADAGVRVQYLHSDIDTITRIEILRELRLGTIDVLVGINLLREGLDLPEVALVAILDADKEGFLRSASSLIQTMGRAARNVDGMVVLYADTVTDSMREAVVGDPAPPRAPDGLQPGARDRPADHPQVGDRHPRAAARQRAAGWPGPGAAGPRCGKNAGGPGQPPRRRSWPRGTPSTPAAAVELITQLEAEMKAAAAELRYEEAALLRDEIAELRASIPG